MLWIQSNALTAPHTQSLTDLLCLVMMLSYDWTIDSVTLYPTTETETGPEQTPRTPSRLPVLTQSRSDSVDQRRAASHLAAPLCHFGSSTNPTKACGAAILDLAEAL